MFIELFMGEQPGGEADEVADGLQLVQRLQPRGGVHPVQGYYCCSERLAHVLHHLDSLRKRRNNSYTSTHGPCLNNGVNAILICTKKEQVLLIFSDFLKGINISNYKCNFFRVYKYCTLIHCKELQQTAGLLKTGHLKMCYDVACLGLRLLTSVNGVEDYELATRYATRSYNKKYCRVVGFLK